MSNRLVSELGWDEGFAIPVANAENKALEDEVSAPFDYLASRQASK